MKPLSYTAILSPRFGLPAGLLLAQFLAATEILGATLRVPEDYPTFRAGLAAATPGDTLLVASGAYAEPGGPAFVNPGVTVIGAGWSNQFTATILSQIELFFTAGADSAIVQDLWINGKHVSSDNSLGVIRRCLLSTPTGNWPDGYLAYVRDGLIIEDSFIRAQVMQEPHVFFNVIGGSFLMRNCVVAIEDGTNFFYVQDLDPRPLLGVLLLDNTIYATGGHLHLVVDGNPPMPGPVYFINNIFRSDFITCSCPNSGQLRLLNNLFYPNLNGSCGVPDPSNIVGVDPQLCDPHFGPPVDLEDFELDAESPCIGAGVGGSTIGALGVGCGLATDVGSGSEVGPGVRFRVTPNPLRHQAVISYSRQLRTPVLEIYDASGRMVDLVQVGAPPYVWTPGADVRAGIYFMRLHSDAGSASTKVVLLPK